MGDSGVRSWNWQMPAFEPRTSSVTDDSNDEEDGNRLISSGPAFGRRLSLPAHLGSVSSPFEPQQKRQSELANKVLQLREALVSARNEFLELRQEASDLQEYSSVKLTRVTRYLGVLSDKTRKLDQVALDYEHRLAALRKEKSEHFNEVVSRKGNTRVVVRAHPKVKDETITATSFPDENTILINNSREEPVEFRFDQVYGPHVSQGELFQDIQPLIQSAIDGYNVSIFACGPKGSGKTYTLEGPSHDRGVYFRAFEELFDLSNGESTPTSKFSFYVTMFELCNEQVEDLLKNVSVDPAKPASTIQLESCDPLVQHKVEHPTDFARVFKAGLENQHMNGLKTQNMSSPFLVVTFHVHYTNTSTGEKQYSKLSLVDLPGSEQQFSSLVRVASALVFKREHVPYEDSKVTQILSDSLGGDSKTLLILNISPSESTVEETKSWLKIAKSCCDSSRTLQNMIFEEQNKDLKLEVEKLKKSLQESEDQCALLFKEVQKAWKDPNRADNSVERRFERDQIVQLRTQVAQYARFDRDQKAELANRASKILALEGKLQQLAESKANKDYKLVSVPSATCDQSTSYRTLEEVNGIAPVANEQLGEELAKRDELIERLHEENEKLFQRLTERSTYSPKVARPEPRLVDDFDLSGSFKNAGVKHSSPHTRSGGNSDPGIITNALQKAERPKTTPAGEYLTAALSDFDPDQYNGPAAVSDAANKLLMLVLAAVIKAGAAREHGMLEEIRGAVFAFIRKLEPRKLMDTMLVSRVRILYVRSLLAKSSELQAFKVPAVERFLEKAGSRSSRTSSSGSSPTRSPVSSQLQSNMRKDLLDEHVPAFRINLKQEKTSKLSSIVLKLRGIDQETWKQHLTGAKLREMNEEARNYAVGNKRLAALFVHTPAGELQRQIRSWLAESFDFLSLTSGDNVGGAMGQLELLSTAIMDGWMAGLGIPTRPSTDSLGQLLSDYTKHVYMSQLQHLKDVAAALATEEAEDLPQVTKIRTALESIDQKRRKILQQMRTDVALLTKEEGGSPVRCPSTASEEARIASLISLGDIINQTEEIRKEAPERATFASKKKFMLSRLDSLIEQTSALLSIDHPCAQKFIKGARQTIESAAEQKEGVAVRNRGTMSSDEGVGGELSSSSGDWGDGNLAQAASEVVQWSVLQFNNGTDTPFIIKCGANSLMQLVIKAQSRISQDAGGKEVVAIVPSPSSLAGLSAEEIKQVLGALPEAFRQLAMARTADGTRARYSRLYKTLAVRVPALRSSISDIEQFEQTTVPKARTPHARRASDSDNFSSDY